MVAPVPTPDTLIAPDLNDVRFSLYQWGSQLVVTAHTGAEPDAGTASRLAARISVDLRQVQAAEAAATVARLAGVNLVCTPAAREHAGSLSISVQDMRADNALRWISRLSGLHLGWADGALVLDAKPILGASRTVIYDVADLAHAPPHFPGPELGWPDPNRTGPDRLPAIGAPEKQASVQDLAELVRKVVASKDG